MQALEEVFNSFEAGGTVFGSISKKDFHNIQRVTPPSHLITTFEGLVMPIDEKVFVCEREARNLATLRDTFLPKLLSGELRVPDAVNLIEDDAP
jgi:type I restriction enzyme S subunit